MDLVVGFLKRMVEIWLDPGVLIPALLIGYIYANRVFSNFLGIMALFALADHVLVVVLYRFRNRTQHTIIEMLTSNIAERIVAFMLVALVVYGIVRAVRGSVKS